ncbi:MAG: hypothetical protein ACKV2T_00515 [Kofleriaceae bacterium]
MAINLNVVAVATNRWASLSTRDAEIDALRGTMRPGFQLVTYQTFIDCIAQIQALLDTDPDNPCLHVVEIYHHGSPTSLDNMMRGTAVAPRGGAPPPPHPSSNDVRNWGTALGGLRLWCDEGKIFLSGCNTGLPRSGPSLAELLAASLPAFPAFQHKIRVYGAAGYLSGSHAGADEEIDETYSTGALWWSVDYPPLQGARRGRGGNAWNEFKNPGW